MRVPPGVCSVIIRVVIFNKITFFFFFHVTEDNDSDVFLLEKKTHVYEIIYIFLFSRTNDNRTSRNPVGHANINNNFVIAGGRRFFFTRRRRFIIAQNYRKKFAI